MSRGAKFWSWLEVGVLRHTPALFFGLLFVAFSVLVDGFFSLQSLRNLAVQAAPTGILAVGMTFLLLVGRVDLSVGAVMFLGGAVFGKLLGLGMSLGVGLAALFATAVVFGLVNHWVSLRFRVVSFIVTLATLYMGRGIAQALTQTRPTPIPPLESWGSVSFAGLDLPVLVFGSVVLVAQLALSQTAWGRQLYAIGCDPVAAQRAGIPVQGVVGIAYVSCSLCAGLAAVVALTQSPTVSPEFGTNVEFTAIAAAVLGGTTLAGGKGSVWPGAVIGACLLQMVVSGLNMQNVDPYLYPLVLGGIVFLAVLVDSQRSRRLEIVERRRTRS